MKGSTVRANFLLPADIYHDFQVVVPKRKMSKVIGRLMRKEIEKRNKSLYKIAQSVEKDTKLNKEMKDWDDTVNDGLEDLEWK